MPITPQEVFERLLPQVVPGYEPRPAQLAMAAAVSAALRDQHPLLCEAGTGTGKTLAYLVPALLSGMKVVVSTGTKHLQEQIFHKDLPLLARALSRPIAAVRLKGISNYLCLRRLSALAPDAGEQEGDLPGPVNPALRRILEFYQRTQTGDRAELPGLADDDPTWGLVSSTSETRLGGRCPFFERCFVTRARRAAQEAELVIVNHHLLCADLAVRARFPEARLLPPYEALICDEAHGLEEVATEYFGVSVSTGRVMALLRDVHRSALGTSEPLPGEAERCWVRLIALLRRHVARPASPPERLASARPSVRLSPEGEADDDRSSVEAAGEGRRLMLHGEHLSGEAGGEAHPALPGEGCERTPRQMALALDTALLGIQDRWAAAGDEAGRQLGRRAAALRDDLALIVEGAERPGGKHVYWLEEQAGAKPGAGAEGWILRAAPVTVGGLLRERLYAECPAVVLTSATLAPEGRFDFARQRLGLLGDDRAAELLLSSPFDYARQAALYLPEDLPEPAEPGFLGAACRRMAELVDLCGGRAFLLFTSARRMRQAYDRLRGHFAGRYTVLLQGDAPKHALCERFKAAAPAVLFATASFWEGVDVIGPALQLVVIDKLPFSPPDDPLLAARCRRLEEDGHDAFATYQVPRAALLLAQGFGRLIRHREDRGIVALLDRRAALRAYGPRVLAGLPPALRRLHRWEDVVRFHEESVAPLSRSLSHPIPRPGPTL